MLFAISAPAQGQVDVRPGLTFGVNLANFGGEDASSSSNVERRRGVVAGGFLLIDVAGPLALQPELLYVQKGQRAEGDTFQGTVTITSKVDYIELPMLVKLQVPVAGPITPTVFGGPSVGVNVNASEEVSRDGRSATQDFDDEIESTELGVHLGAGLDISTGTGILTVDVRYQLGVNNIVSEGPGELKNRGIGIVGGFAF